jgi:hypothetical protein
LRFEGKKPSAPEPLHARSRPMTGFMATLSPEQQEAALAYRGDDTQGDPAYR